MTSASRRHPAARYRFSYRVTAFAFLALQAFMTAPSPLYGLYARRDGFSSLTITLVYAAYALGVIVSLFFAGHLSDQHGRRPFLLAALGLDAVSAVVFLAWPALPGLYLARVLCGLAVGVTASTATAYLRELYLAHRPAEQLHRAQLLAGSVTLGGLGIGALAVGLIAQYVPHPLTVPYLVMLAAFALSAVGIYFAAETRPRLEPRPPYRPQRASVPPESRSEFVSALVGIALAFAVMGMFIGLAGTFLTGVLHHTSLALAGTAIGLVFAAGVAGHGRDGRVEVAGGARRQHRADYRRARAAGRLGLAAPAELGPVPVRGSGHRRGRRRHVQGQPRRDRRDLAGLAARRVACRLLPLRLHRHFRAGHRPRPGPAAR